MTTIIKDGTGSGQFAGVSDNRIDVSARQNERIFYIARDDEKVFLTILELTISEADTFEAVGYFEYTGTQYIFIKDVRFSTDEEAGPTQFKMFKNPTVSGGEDCGLINTNFTSQRSIQLTCKDADSAISVSGGDLLFPCIINNVGTSNYDFHNCLILGTGGKLGFTAKSPTVGTKINIFILFHEEPID